MPTGKKLCQCLCQNRYWVADILSLKASMKCRIYFPCWLLPEKLSGMPFTYPGYPAASTRKFDKSAKIIWCGELCNSPVNISPATTPIFQGVFIPTCRIGFQPVVNVLRFFDLYRRGMGCPRIQGAPASINAFSSSGILTSRIFSNATLISSNSFSATSRLCSMVSVGP